MIVRGLPSVVEVVSFAALVNGWLAAIIYAFNPQGFVSFFDHFDRQDPVWCLFFDFPLDRGLLLSGVGHSSILKGKMKSQSTRQLGQCHCHLARPAGTTRRRLPAAVRLAAASGELTIA